MADVRIRRASPSDLAAVNALFEELQGPHADHYPQIFVRTGTEDYCRAVLGAEDHAVFVAEREAATIGMAIAQLLDETSPHCFPMKLCRLNSIVVTEKARGTGAGRALIGEVEAFARQNGVRDLRLYVAEFNERAIELYERMGFRIRAHAMGKLIGETD